MHRLALALLAGCSFATSGAPARHDGRVAPDCTTSAALPVIDASATILAAVVGIPLIVQGGDGCDPNSDCHDDGPGVMRRLGIGMVAVGAVYALGAYVGFSNVHSCKAAIARHQRAASSVAPWSWRRELSMPSITRYAPVSSTTPNGP
jgi:hypothetical protein